MDDDHVMTAVCDARSYILDVNVCVIFSEIKTREKFISANWNINRTFGSSQEAHGEASSTCNGFVLSLAGLGVKYKAQRK